MRGGTAVKGLQVRILPLNCYPLPARARRIGTLDAVIAQLN